VAKIRNQQKIIIMKKLFFLLLFPLWGIGGFPAFAQSHINIELLSATYTAPAVQFRVSWNSIPAVDGETHNSKIWLWVDFRKIENNQPSGAWTRATVANPSSGTVAPETDKGFWLQGNSGSYSQTVTVALTNIPANTKFNWCAYASDCPPNVTFNEGTYTFKGTTNFIVSEPARTLTTETIAKSSLTVTLSSTFTDATGCPGIGSLYCPYTESDLYMDATHLCQQRATGAQNWEAWIKDTRDNELYRIVLMPDALWWLAEEMRYDASATKQSYKCTTLTQRTIYNRDNIACPAGWLLPTTAQFATLHSLVTDTELLAYTYTTKCGTGSDWYGFTIIPDPARSDVGNAKYPTTCGVNDWEYPTSWMTREGTRLHAAGCTTAGNWVLYDHSWNQVRCIR
jgi:uncharacterized protein (TIGR02145 family)